MVTSYARCIKREKKRSRFLVILEFSKTIIIEKLNDDQIPVNYIAVYFLLTKSNILIEIHLKTYKLLR